MAGKIIYQLYLFGFLGQPQSALYVATKHLAHIRDLGADVVWVGPIFSSLWADHGYDISNYWTVDPRFGTMADFDRFVQEAHRYGLEVIIDLVLNHTSTEHAWFKDQQYREQLYCWSESDREGWKNLFDHGPAWEYDEKADKYYLHLFHKDQADLNWFPDGPDGSINQELAWRFQTITSFWLSSHDVDGFRLDIPQSINKDLVADKLELSDLLYGTSAAKVINAVFENRDCFLIMECMDPTYGNLVDYYWSETPVDFVLNILLKDEIKKGEDHFLALLKQSVRHKGFMLDLESHDSPRFLSHGVNFEDMMYYLFGTGAKGVCLYQGQELALDNPSEEELPNSELLKLDAMTKMRFDSGEPIENLRSDSRANARIPLPLEEFEKQIANPVSSWNATKRWIDCFHLQNS